MLRAPALRAAIEAAHAHALYVERAARGCRAPRQGEQVDLLGPPEEMSDDAWTSLADLVEVLGRALADDDLLAFPSPREVEAAGLQLALASVELDLARTRGDVRP